MEDKLNQLQLTSYWLANPANHPLALKTSQSAAGSKGVLLLAKDGSGTIIMVTNMKTHTPRFHLPGVSDAARQSGLGSRSKG